MRANLEENGSKSVENLNPSVESNTPPADHEVEAEKPEDDQSGRKISEPTPWDPSKIRIDTKHFSLREMYTFVKDGELDLAPDFQRAFVWKEAQQVRLVESVLLGIPLPAFYFNQDPDGARQVIDGLQRLTTVRRFMDGQLTLSEENLEYLKDLKGRRYETLEVPLKRRFAGTQIVAHIVEPQTPDEVKYDIFNRVNTGGSPLEPQEIRHCMSKERSRSLLRRMTESRAFEEATDWMFWEKSEETKEWVKDNRRMLDRELALRFCAFYITPLEQYAAAESLNAFLLEFTRRIDGKSARHPQLSQADIDKMESAFEVAMQNARTVLGKEAFRRPGTGGRRGPLNRAIFEAHALALADFAPDMVAANKVKLAEELQLLFKDPAYESAVRIATGDIRNVRRRIERTVNAVRQVLL